MIFCFELKTVITTCVKDLSVRKWAPDVPKCRTVGKSEMKLLIVLHFGTFGLPKCRIIGKYGMKLQIVLHFEDFFHPSALQLRSQIHNKNDPRPIKNEAKI